MWKWAIGLVIFIAVILAGALLWDYAAGTLAPVSWAVAVSAVATFFTMLFALPPRGQITKSGTRNAITGTFIVTYFMLLGLFVFFHSDKDVSPITNTLVTNFTFLMGVVIASHFGTSTYEKVAQVKATAENPNSQQAITAAAADSETQGTS
jgi:hypothetical protein